MVRKAVEDAFCVRVVVVEGRTYVVAKVYVTEVHAVINYGDVDPLTLNPLCPHRLDIYVLSGLVS